MQLYCWVILFAPALPNVPANMLNGAHRMCRGPPPWAQLAAHHLLKLLSALPLYQANASVHFQRSQKTELRIQYLKQQFQFLISLPALSNSEHVGVVGVYRGTTQKA